MAYVVYTPNLFEPLKGVQKHEINERLSIRDCVRKLFGVFDFSTPVICVLNGDYICRRDKEQNPKWEVTFVNRGDVLHFMGTPGDVVTLTIIIVVLVVALTVFTLLNQPKIPGQLPESDPVYSTKGQANSVRLGEPIEVCYGRNRIYPSLAARPFFQYIDNDQFQFSLFCIGQGSFEIEQILITDTDIDEFEEVEYEIVEPEAAVTLIPTNVITSIAVGGQTLFAPNEEEYVSDGWVGPFVSSAAGTEVEKIQVDVTMPKGLYTQDSKGRIQSLSITLEIEIREIDDGGAPIGAFIALPANSPYTITAATTTPQRRTISSNVTPARYEVRMRRTSDKETSDRAGNDIIWEGLRGYITDSEATFGDVTLLAVKIRATNNLNARSASQFNVIATRKLPILESDGWSAPQVTRSIVWAFADVFRSLYGGRVADAYLDELTLWELEDLYAIRNEHFDFVFRDPITVWDAAQAIAQVGRAAPILAGSLISIKRDGPVEIPVTMFTPDNIVKNTFKRNVKLFEVDEFDSVEIEYTDVTTGYKQETVLATLPGGTLDNPKKIRLAGCQDRTHAYRWGMHRRASDRYLRDNVSFETGMEGHIPSFGDLVVVTHDVFQPRTAQHGIILQAQRDGITDMYQLWLSEPLIWDVDTGERIFYFRGRKAEMLGPYPAFETSDPKQAVVQISESDPADFDFLLGGKTEPMLFLFGVNGSVSKLCKIVKLEPQGGERVGVVAVGYNPIIYSFDELDPSPLDTVPVPPIPPDLPTIDDLYITRVDASEFIIQVAWSASFGAQYYVVQTSNDGENWEDRGIVAAQTSIQLPVFPGDLWVRVAGVNNGQGPWKEETLVIGVMNSIEILQQWVYLVWEVTWWEVLSAIGYQAKVYDNSGGSPVLKHTYNLGASDLNLEYDYTQAVIDGNLVRDMLVTVDAEFVDGLTGAPASIELHNDIPLPPTNPGHDLDSEDSDVIRYRLFWDVPTEGDLITVKVWLESTSGFNPSIETPYYSFTAGSPGYAGIPTETVVEVPLDSPANHPEYYWRVALFDVWGSEIETNITAEQTIPAWP